MAACNPAVGERRDAFSTGAVVAVRQVRLCGLSDVCDAVVIWLVQSGFA